MTKEELKQEAEEYFINLYECKTKEMMIDAYVTGAEPSEKHIASLKKIDMQFYSLNASDYSKLKR